MEKQYDATGLEAKWYPRWEQAGLFRPGADHEEEPFIITLPPPNVTGILHIGHCLGAGIMDALCRYYRMCGRPTLFVPGTDHASIATENKVIEALKTEGLDKRELGRESFLRRAWKWADEHHDRIVDQFKRYGVSLDWSREAFTMDEARSRAVATAFVRLYEKGLIYRGDYMVNWSVAQRSAVSDEEVVHREVRGKLWHFRYGLEGGGHLTVATTRPETMLGDTAVAIHPDHPKTAHLRGRTVVLPLVGRRIPVIEDAHVDPEFGSGCVKVTPAHDPNDYEIGRRHGLEFVNILAPDGTLNDNVPEKYRGQDRFEARQQVVADLEGQGLLEKIEEHTHMVGYHDRTETIIEPYISKQWFLRMDELAAPAVAAVEEEAVRMFPERWVGVYFNWMRNIRDWCISRQLWWGHRIPYWECRECGEGIAAVESPQDCPICGAERLEQDADVLDTWFSSWLWTFSPLGWPEQTEDLSRYHPTSVLVTAPDIIFFWVARMVMASYEFLAEPPFREVIFTGIIRDAQGRKLSKSLGNSPDPIALMEQYGADSLRFVLTMLTPTGQDINFDPLSCEMGRNFCNKIWNATRLLFSNLEGSGLEIAPGDPGRMRREIVIEGSEVNGAELLRALHAQVFGADVRPEALGELELEDRWMLHRIARAAQRLEREMEARRLNDACYAAYDCFWHEFCDWYLEAIKPRLRGGDTAGRRTALLVALSAHAILLRLLHPFLPYITEELWSIHPAATGFVMTAPMPRFGRAPYQEAADRFELARQIVGAVRNLRNELGVPPGKRGHAVVRGEAARHEVLQQLSSHVETLAKLEKVEIREPGEPLRQAISAVVDDVEVFLPMKGLVDLEKERQRLGREHDQISGRLSAVRAKLANENFLQRAPAEIVQRENELAAALGETLGRLERQIAALED